MSKLREIKRRINSVSNIGQVTNAMQLVAASRMRRAQDNAVKGKIYADKIKELMVRLSSQQSRPALEKFPLIQPNDAKSVMLLIFSPQRGLAGSLPTNHLRFVMRLIQQIQGEDQEFRLVSIGSKIRDQLTHRGLPIYADFSEIPEQPTTADIRPILKMVEDAYLSGEVGQVLLVYPDFVNPLTQNPVSRVLLPLDVSTLSAFGEESLIDTESVTGEFVYEPGQVEILEELIPSYLETQVYQAFLEKVASEYSARMVAMKNATDNAKEIKEILTLDYNKMRQNQITTEISEIVGGRIEQTV